MWRQVCKFSLYMKYKMLLSFSFVCMCVPLNLITPRQLRLISMMSVQRSVPRSLSCYIFCELKWNPTAFLVGFFAKPFMLILIASKDCTKQNQAQPGQVQTFLFNKICLLCKKNTCHPKMRAYTFVQNLLGQDYINTKKKCRLRQESHLSMQICIF